MKLDTDRDSPRGFFRFHSKLKAIERQLFAHVRAAGDLRTLYGMEEVLYCVLSDEMDNDLAMDLSRILVTQAVERVIHDEERDISSVPHGISRAERLAAFFEEGCPFCEAKVDVVEESEPDEDCECCAMLVREWRAEHADALRRFESPRANGSSRATASAR